jgi:hypothetical protein
MKLLSAIILTGTALAQAQTIAIVNRTKSVSDATLQSVMAAVAQQVHNEYKAQWGYDATFKFVGKNQSTSSSDWNCYIDDRKGDYHTVSKGVPVAYCHVNGVSVDYWTNTISHEVLEMRTDAFVNTTYTRPDGSTGYVEVCDACETNDQGYRINSILMSDFVYPSWFVASGKAPYDQTRLITAPFQVLPGGYLP